MNKLINAKNFVEDFSKLFTHNQSKWSHGGWIKPNSKSLKVMWGDLFLFLCNVIYFCLLFMFVIFCGYTGTTKIQFYHFKNVWGVSVSEGGAVEAIE